MMSSWRITRKEFLRLMGRLAAFNMWPVVAGRKGHNEAPAAVWDAHTHVGSCYAICHLTDKRYTVEQLIAEMDRCGVRRAVVTGGGKAHELDEMNRMARAAIKRYPDRLIGLLRVNPLIESYLAAIEDGVREDGFRGIKLHPSQDSYQILDPRVEPVMELAARLDVPVMIHSGTIPYSMPGQIADLAVKFRQVKIIMAHAGGTELYQHAIPSARRSENIYLEFSHQPFTALIREAIDRLGKERVLFGSNWPAMSMRPYVETYKASRLLSDDEKERLLGLNLQRLLNLKDDDVK